MFDPGNSRIALFTDAAELARTVSLRLAAPRLSFAGVLANGDFLLTAGGVQMRRGTWRETAYVVRIAADGSSLDTVAVVPGEEFYSAEAGGQPVLGIRPFGRRSVVAAAGNWVAINTQDDCVIHWVDPGAGDQLAVRLPCEERKVTKTMVASYENDRLSGFRDERALKRARALFASGRVPYPRRLPTVGGLLTSTDYSLWIEQGYAPGDTLRTWIVLGPGGRLTAICEVEANVGLRAVHQETVVAIARDEVGTARVELHAFDPRGSEIAPPVTRPGEPAGTGPQSRGGIP